MAQELQKEIDLVLEKRAQALGTALFQALIKKELNFEVLSVQDAMEYVRQKLQEVEDRFPFTAEQEAHKNQ